MGCAMPCGASYGLVMRALALVHDMVLTLAVTALGALQLALVFWPVSGEIVQRLLP